MTNTTTETSHARRVADVANTKAVARVADVISTSSAQRARVIEELVSWTTAKGGGTWDCEAAGLRLRAGVSLPGWCTADFRGLLYATRTRDNLNARPQLIAHLATIADTCRPNVLAYQGQRAESQFVSEHRFRVVSLSPDGLSFAMRSDVEGWDSVYALRSDTKAKWHLPRTKTFDLIDHATLHYISWAKADGVLHEVGAGPMALGMTRFDTAVIIVYPPPDATAAQRDQYVHRAVLAYRRLSSNAVERTSPPYEPKRRLEIVEANFEVVC